MKSLKQTHHINVPKEEVWQALINPKIINEWGAGPAKMSDKEGEKFSLWDGSIFGTNKRVQTEKELAQEWYGGNWKEPSYVIISLKQKKGGIKTKDKGVGITVSLVHENIPQDMYEDIKYGWKYYYFGPMKLYLEGKHGNPDVDYHQGG